MINRSAAILNNFRETPTIEDKMNELRLITSMKKAQVEEIKKMAEENPIEDIKKAFVSDPAVKENEVIAVDPVTQNLRKFFIQKDRKLFDVKEEVSVNDFIKGVMSSVDDPSLKKAIVSEDMRKQIECKKRNGSVLKLSLPSLVFFRFL